jgi:hypothetical protein
MMFADLTRAHAEPVIGGPSNECLEEVAIEVHAVEHDEATTDGDLGGRRAGLSAEPLR